MTRRERLENKLAKRQEWAEKADAKSEALYHSNDCYRGDVAFNTQPGHIPERARAIRRTDKAFELSKLANHHTSKAGGLERQLDRSVFSDDADAIDQLRARIAEREAERDRLKAVNAAWRKAGKPTSDNTDGWAKVAAILNMPAEMMGPFRLDFARCHWHDKPIPSYKFTNLGGNIRRDKERIEEIERRAVQSAKAEAAPGGVLITGTTDYVNVTFAEKPAREVLDALKAAGFAWGGGCWGGYRAKLPACVLAMATGGLA